VTVLVTGGSGLVGSHVIEALRARGDQVRALARERSHARVRALGAEPVVGDVTSADDWQRAARGASAVVHGAALVVQRGTLEQYIAVNVGGTRLAAATARALAIPLVHISSVAVYGRAPVYETSPGEVHEEYPFGTIPDRDFYARSKRAAEGVLREAVLTGGLSATCIRPDVIYGERDRLFTPMVVAGARLSVMPMIGEGSNHLACVYAGNVASAVLAALDARLPGFRAFNVTHDAPPSLNCRQFFEAFGEELGVRLRTIEVPPGLARLGVAVWTRWQRLWNPKGYAGLGRSALSFLGGENPYSSARLTRELGWRPPWDTRTAIRRTVRGRGQPGEPPAPAKHKARDQARAL
jgi:nucleoside-diphosphate-sugar epimerase